MEEQNRQLVIEAAYKIEEKTKSNLKAKEAKKNKRLSNSNTDFIDDKPQPPQEAGDFFQQFDDQNLINDASQDAEAFKTPDGHSHADSLENLDNEITGELEEAEKKIKKKKKKDKNDPDRQRKKEEKKKKKMLKKMKEEEGIPS